MRLIPDGISFPGPCANESDAVEKASGQRPGIVFVSSIDPNGKNVILVLGAQRSGTTWLAKVFDSHPDVVYRHEPDTVLRSAIVPVLCPAADSGRFLPDARDYLLQLLDLRAIKSVGSMPLFSKNFRGPASEQLRALMIYGAKAATPAFGRRFGSAIRIPDLAAQAPSVRYVMKSVSSRGRVKIFADALPESLIVFLVRHPCGQVASTVNGIQDGRFERSARLAEILDTDEARQAGLTEGVFRQMDLIEQCAWHWAILNQKAINDLPTSPRSVVAVYETLCAAPADEAKKLFRFAGLDWHRQSENFIQKSTTANGADRFYGVERNSLAAANKWRDTLDRSTQQRILDIARQVAVGNMFTE